MDLNGIVTLKDYAEAHELDYKALRRFARKNDIGAVKFANTWVIASDAPVPELPEPGMRGFKSARTDGRKRYIAYMTDAEAAAHVAAAGADALIDTRERARARREARKAAKAAENATE